MTKKKKNSFLTKDDYNGFSSSCSSDVSNNLEPYTKEIFVNFEQLRNADSKKKEIITTFQRMNQEGGKECVEKCGDQNESLQDGKPQNCDTLNCVQSNCKESYHYTEISNVEKQLSNDRGKRNKKVTNLNYIVHYNRYKPTRTVPVFNKNKSSVPFVKRNKNQYVNCNFRYYVKDKNYLTQNIDDNIKWEQIEKVDYIIFDNTPLSCPICLEDNIISPRITKCRHIFCFFCILKYFIDEEKRIWKKCPICFEIINENDLRLVKFHYVKNYNINDSINMCLLYTENKKINLKSDRLYFNNSFKITNKNFVKNSKMVDYKYVVNIDYMNKNLTTFSQNHSNKILKLNLNLGIQFAKLFYIYNPLAIWIKDLTIFNFILTNKKMHMHASDQNVIEKAISDIKLKISQYLNIPIEKFNPELNIDEKTFDSFYMYDNLAHDVYSQKYTTKENFTAGEKFPLHSHKSNNEGSTDFKYLEIVQIYFYQCIDGQCIYLDPFILNLLFFECDNDMNRMPKFLCNKQITFIESFELDEKTRKRYSILFHLPLGVKVLFVSLDIDDILSERTKAHFSKEISDRKKKHHSIMRKKIKEEKYFKMLADEEMDRKEKRYWNLPQNTINIQSDTINISSNMLRLANPMGEEKYLHGELHDTMVKQDYSAACEAHVDNAITDNAITDNAITNKAITNKAITNKAITNKAITNKAITDNVKGKLVIGEQKGKTEKEGNVKWKNVGLMNATNKNNEHTPKRSFLEIATQKCDAENIKLDMGKKKEEVLSIGSGSVHVNLIDLINTKRGKKKKKK
ncbi:hypothetical protein, conserved [Plasmodium gonderi]|uniref:RING-type domain-containing protein n=1 Tax=Plasmodium gonderi TaxID=77519 RepID=A0A1Y1JJB4_PLAGO|nr:hypothetical protein, conserved [Plasmodium gonderi]GAW80543.1 hypothetical protein, conserved [Plasmodium gonderi]